MGPRISRPPDNAEERPRDPPRLGAEGAGLYEAVLAPAAAAGQRVAVLHVDVDMMRSINLNMGETVGDQALSAVAQRLRAQLPKNARLWRLASDEFIAAFAVGGGMPEGAVFAQRIREAFAEPLSIVPYTLPVTLSVGVAMYPDHAADASMLLMRAERALQQAKQDGFNSTSVYSPEIDATAAPVSPASLDGFVERFVQALDNDEFRLLYQPVVSANDGSLVGLSALLRWHRSDGVLRPSRFLDTVERLGLSPRLSVWVLEAAARQLSEWRASGLEDLSVSVHLPGAMVAQPDCADRIGDLLHRHALPGEALELELSETTFASETRRVHETLTGLRKLRTTLTIQDFGSGGLSFAALTRYPLDRIKINRNFIRNVASETRSAAIVRGIITMGHQLALKVTAKGVESEAELGFLRRNHCDFFQGHLFSPARPVEELGELLRQRALLPSAFAATRPERTLLLLDDDDNVLRSLVRLFRRDRYRILATSSVREAFDLLASNAVQVILSDQRMADMSGTEFLTRVRDLYPDTIRMVLSGYTDLATITDAINRGAIYRFLTKPWNDDELREHILAAFRYYERRAAGETGY